MKILVTGGSGFIGTNLLEELVIKGHEVLNIDIKKPMNVKQLSLWKSVDITDFKSFREAVIGFAPDYIVHLAARTDLDGKTVNEYPANTIGVENLMSITKEIPELKKVIITSSKFVNPNGYVPTSQFDYRPHTIYGESKVITEKEVWKNKPHCDWCIIRPTSIWGPWFGVPYRNFFDMVMKRLYFHIGNTRCFKTYGYIGNSVYQIERLLFTDTLDEENKVFYIGDEPAYEINEWADEIADELGFKIYKMPIIVFKTAARIGDLLKKIKIPFPMTTFRYMNMTHDGVNDVSGTYKVIPTVPYSRHEGTKRTIEWIREYEEKR
ncbi:NAD(P)-dependent oxidoreductase (plasmid) [Paenibacillus cellulosilyticus]|nr:NAD(P)-dependent oxidoreductase [Paenibacillus cellulosilyticus]